MKTKKQANAIVTVIEPNLEGIVMNYSIHVVRERNRYEVRINTERSAYLDNLLDKFYEVLMGGIWIYSPNSEQYILS
jgi:CRISPR/Cas system-associated exonuclease Cas4 (RecB family)